MSKLFGPNWKTSASAICSFLMVTGLFISGYLATQVQHPTGWEIQLSSALTFMIALLKVWVGFLQIDAGTVMAKVPGEAQPQIVPSTEIPLDPKAKVVKES